MQLCAAHATCLCRVCRSIPELKAEREIHGANYSTTSKAIQDHINDLKAGGHLPQNASFDYVSHCLSSRLDPALFPYRPKVRQSRRQRESNRENVLIIFCMICSPA